MISMAMYIDWFDLEAYTTYWYNFGLFILANLDLNLNVLQIYPNWIAILFLIFLLESNIPLTTYEDFLELPVKQLTDSLSVSSLNTSGQKIDIIARTFAAMELKLDIIQSSVSQSNILQSNYNKIEGTENSWS